jgi:hypothetical protein
VSKAGRWLFAVFLCVMTLAIPVSASTSPTSEVPYNIPPRVGVLSMGSGEIFWERFGHNAIVIDDPALPSPISYNFGYFDLDDTDFFQRFLKGDMRYMLMALPLNQDLAYYRQVGRSATLQWLNLEPQQAIALAQLLEENAKPENAYYRYDYFTDNCATKVRDALDHVLGGQLRKQLEVRSTGDTYRSEALRLASPTWWMQLGFDIALGPQADRPLTRWQQGFLPRQLADDLRSITLNNQQPLVAFELELLPQKQAAEPLFFVRSLWLWLVTGAGLALVFLVMQAHWPRSMALFAGGVWLLCGVFGWILAVGWALTEHHMLWGNRNLLLMSPLCLLLLPSVPQLARKQALSPLMRYVLLAIAISAVIACLPLWLQTQPQRNGHWLALLLPLHLAFANAWAGRVKS